MPGLDAGERLPTSMASTTSAPLRRTWRISLPGARELLVGARPLVMGVVNITPDSFSDGGLWLEPARAIEHGLELLDAGADLLDLGAESTRPGGGVYGAGARPVPAEEELARLLPVLEGLRRATDAPLSVDTRKGAVAGAALAAGADLINDISRLSDPALADAVADAACPLIVMHSRGQIPTMQKSIRYSDLLSEIAAELEEAADRAIGAGVPRDQILLDPGIGFGKTCAQNLLLLRHLDFFHRLERPLVIGASRKSFIGDLTGAPPRERLAGSLAAAAWAAVHQVAVIRVHDVDQTVQFLDVWSAIRTAAEEAGE